MDQTVIRRPLTAEDRVRARVSPSRICDGQSGTGTGFSPSSSVFLYQYHHSTRAPYSYIIWGKTNRSVRGRSSETRSRPIDEKRTPADIAGKSLQLYSVTLHAYSLEH
jgi:hypothetical protein